MAAIFRITDGTTSIDMLDRWGFLIESWRPNIPGYKGGGAFQESAMSFGRQLIDKQFENLIDTFSIKLFSQTQDNAILRMQDLRRLLEKASYFWTAEWQNDPVWIEAKASIETNIRYALVILGRISEDENPYSQPFLQPDCTAVMNGLTLVIEHQLWSSSIPGAGTSVPLATIATFDGRNLGNVDDTGARETQTDFDSIFITNKHVVANLSDVYIDDGGAFSANLLDAALPYAMFPAVPVNGDALYLGCDTTITDSGPFTSLVFDISVVETGNWDLAWQYWDGGAWATLDRQDNTANDGIVDVDPFTTLGVRCVSWLAPIDWATTVVNGVTGYWVRCLVFNAGAGPHTIPTQQNRNIYAVSWPYIEVQAMDVLGDIPALLNISMRNQSDDNAGGASPISWSNDVFMGLRSVSRGENFTAFLNISDEQNPAGVTVTAVGVPSTMATDVQASTGRLINVVNQGALAVSATIRIAAPLYEQYVGAYLVFVRARQISGAVGDILMRVTTDIGGTGLTQPDKAFTDVHATRFELLSFGKVTLPGDALGYGSVTFSIYLDGDGAADVDLESLILIPVDEMAFEAKDPDTDQALGIGYRGDADSSFLSVDSVSAPKKITRAAVGRYATGLLIGNYRFIGNSNVLLQSNARQRLWILNTQLNDGSGDVVSRCDNSNANTVKAIQSARYLSMRGGR